MSLWTGFCPLLNVYFNNVQINRYRVAHGEFPFTATCSEKEETRNISFYSDKQLICVGRLLVYKIYSCSKLFDIPEKCGMEAEEDRGNQGS